MTQPHDSTEDPASRTTSMPVLTYSGADRTEIPSPAANAALAVSLLCVPISFLTCRTMGPTTGSWLLLLPLVGLALAGVSVRGPVGPATRKRAAHAAWIAGAQLGLVAVAAILLPSMGRPREPAQRIKCASNLRQIGQSLGIYLQGHGGTYPPSWGELLEDGDLTSQVFVCPSTDHRVASGPTTRAAAQQLQTPGFCSYVYALPGGVPATSITGAHVIAYEPLSNHPVWGEYGRGIHVLYGDGTVTWMPETEARHLIAELEAGFNPPRPPPTQSTTAK